jgi:hypothetical protein
MPAYESVSPIGILHLIMSTYLEIKLFNLESEDDCKILPPLPLRSPYLLKRRGIF